MAVWIKMSLGMEVGLGPGDFVLDWDPAPPSPKGGRRLGAPQFLAHVYCGKTAGMEVDLGPGHIVLHGDRAPTGTELPPLRKGHSSPSSFQPMFIVATVAHLSY